MADEKDIARNGGASAEIYTEWLQESAEFRRDYRQRLTVLKAKDMPFENSPDGLLKHMVQSKGSGPFTATRAKAQFNPMINRSSVLLITRQ